MRPPDIQSDVCIREDMSDNKFLNMYEGRDENGRGGGGGNVDAISNREKQVC